MTLPVYQSFNEGKTAGATTVVVPKPSGVVSGDLLIGFLSSDGGGETHLPPSGWNVIYNNVSESSSKQTFSLWWRVATGTEGSSFTFQCTSSSEALYAWVIRISGAHQTDPIHKKNIYSGDSLNTIHIAVTTEVDDCLMVWAFGADHGDVTIDGGWQYNETNITVDKSDTGNGSCSGGCAWENQVDAGDSGAGRCDLTGIEEWVAVTIAIQPPAGGAFEYTG
ncbi:MAG: hypothetical protein KAW56_08830, partial [Candidatus Marinimicrobia bacterium]|nr:hypothetical protein [Candidatus Neomarinimicrobiota bacterium]